MNCKYIQVILSYQLQFSEYASQTNEDGSPIKPWISLSGDDDGRHYILYPESEDKDNWTYIKEVVIGNYYSLWICFEQYSHAFQIHCLF